MNATEIAYLEARIEEERRRKVEEAEAAYRRDMKALEVVRGLYERYGAVEVPEETEAAPSESIVEPEPEPETQDPPDAAGAAEEDQRVEADEPEPVAAERQVTMYADETTGEPRQGIPDFAGDPESTAGREVPEGHKLCKRCGPVLGLKPLSAFGRHSGFADRRDNRCLECRNEMKRLKRAGLPDPGPQVPAENPEEEEPRRETSEEPDEYGNGLVASSGSPMRITVLPRTPAFHAEGEDVLSKVAAESPRREAPEPRFCANGDGCMSVKHTGGPTKLNSQNGGTICFGCAERDKALGRPSPDAVPLPIVRKNQGEDRGGW